MMHKNYFKLSALAIGLGMSIAANADVTVPSLQGGFEVGLEANYLKPYGLNTIYANNNNTHTENNSEISNRSSFKNEPKFKFGFGIKLAYVFPNTANDISLVYSRYKGATESSASWEYISTSVEPNGKIDETRTPSKASSKLEAKQEQIDVLLGQYLQLGNNTQLHLTTGLSYAKLALSDMIESALLRSLDLATIFESRKELLSKFKGLGPTLGLDLVYSLGDSGWGLKTGLQTALLVGKRDASSSLSSIQYYYQGGDSILVDNSYSVQPTKYRVIPAVAAKLGLNYEHSLNSVYNVGIEAGYQVKSYLNVDGHEANSSNFTLAGPYASLKLGVC